ATAQMAQDPALREEIDALIDSGTGPANAVEQVVDTFAQMFLSAGGYLAERVTDLRSVRDRVVARVLGVAEPGVPTLREPSIVVAEDFSPADTATLDLDNTAAIVTRLGGPTSHTAIIAAQLGIPCVVRADGVGSLLDGDVVAVDAAHGTVTKDPSPALREAIARRVEVIAELASDDAPAATADGVPVQLLANIGTAVDATRAAPAAVDGVGLFRTEVLFLDRNTAPTVEEQADVYARVLETFGGRKVVIRTLDAGADKPLAFATQPDEDNPALGVRGYRLVRIDESLLDTQLAALADAGRRSGVSPWVMAPMIATPAEARDFAERARGHGVETVGVMIEIPAAALRAREILDQVDFVSLGTNDLTQYTMATDRLRGELSDLLDIWQPAVLDLVAATAMAGLEAGKPVGVCGESAGDPVMALVLHGLGVTSLSMSVSATPLVRFALRHHTADQCRLIAQAARSSSGAAQARAAALALVSRDVRDALGL
ncbi:MAG: phosphoenolpyruvate--protein phosphotransferase, partial [Actinomycetales bacterium]|nr:phosphoenolpyruvate--protein phosphotransferase [Actinomycetales bacterium]